MLALIFQCVNALFVSPNEEEDADIDYSSQYEDEICNTTECFKTAENVKSWIDESVDPCENFYKFACGEFVKKTKLPEGTPAVDIRILFQDIVDEKLNEILNEKEIKDEAKPFALIKQFYKSCMDTEINEERGEKPLIDLLDSFGGWPILKGDKWSQDEFDWTQTIKKIRMHGIKMDPIVSLHVRSLNKTTYACYVI